jgi:uncharacterized protein (TIGR00299 family) protein
MRTGYLECGSGASGDMLLGALLGAGWPEESLRDVAAVLGVDVRIRVEPTSRRGVPALRVEVEEAGPPADRPYPELDRLVRESALREDVKARARAVLRRMAEVESDLHGVPVDRVHLHELGGLDTLVDVCGVLEGVRALGLERVVASPVNVGGGWATIRHGTVPVPAPATAALMRGLPVYGGEGEGELLTPTGAALLGVLVAEWGPLPLMRLERVGAGAGRLDPPRANVLRLFVGESLGGEERAGEGSGSSDPRTERLVVLEASIDDMAPQLYPYVTSRLLDAGALDVMTVPAVMKKGRPGHLLRVLAEPEKASDLIGLLLGETTTLGVRRYEVTRVAVARGMVEVETEFGPVPVKVSTDPAGGLTLTPEFDACRALAERHGVPLKRVLAAAYREAAAREARGRGEGR